MQRIRTGIDLCDVRDLWERLIRSPALRDEIFSPAEIAYCESCAHPAPHYAARFAAKEAFAKALGLDLLGLELWRVELVHSDERSRPRLEISCEEIYTLVCERLGTQSFELDISVSHERDYAVASVVLLVME